MFKSIIEILLKGFFSGQEIETTDLLKADQQIKGLLHNILLLLGGTLMFCMGLYRYSQGNNVLAAIEFSLLGIMILLYILSFFKISFNVLSFFTMLSLIAIATIAISGDLYIIGMLVSILFPIIFLLLFGLKIGIALSMLLLMVIVVLRFPFFFTPGFNQYFHLGIVGLYFFMVIIQIFNALSLNFRNNVIANITNSLRAEHDQMAAMKDNLKTAIFLLNEKIEIQPQYSRSLETIVQEEDLAGENFLTILSSSIKPKDIKTLEYFFDMVINRKFESEMLEDINPLTQFVFINRKTLEEKTLRCTFSPITGKDNKPYLLATMEDITREIELQQQLSEEDNRRQNEMNAVYEIVHLDSQVLLDFIEDADFEFSHINAILKADKRSTPTQVLNEIYNSIHSIKSNALILGLNSYSQQLHSYEDEIKSIRNLDKEPTFEDFLRLTFLLETLIKTNDGFKQIIDKISAFSKKSTAQKDEIKVFAELLEENVRKTSLGKGKIVNLKITELDEQVIQRGPRRIIKDMITQLLRNSVSHGIEAPEDRITLGKTEAGNITLSITTANDNIHIVLQDDGKGIDFTAVAEKAKQLNLLNETELTNQSKLLNLLFSTNFSTAKIVDLYAGRGAGLSIVKKTINDMNGTLKLKTKENVGVKWTIDIPFKA